MPILSDIEAELDAKLATEAERKERVTGGGVSCEFVRDGRDVVGYRVRIQIGLMAHEFAQRASAGEPDIEQIVDDFGAKVVAEIERRQKLAEEEEPIRR